MRREDVWGICGRMAIGKSASKWENDVSDFRVREDFSEVPVVLNATPLAYFVLSPFGFSALGRIASGMEARWAILQDVFQGCWAEAATITPPT